MRIGFILLLFMVFQASAQNLVPNSGFDDNIEGYVLEWKQPKGQYYHYETRWVTNAEFRGLENVNGLCLLYPERAEYMAIKLKKPLEKGKVYRVKIDMMIDSKETRKPGPIHAIEWKFYTSEPFVRDRNRLFEQPDVVFPVANDFPKDSFATFKETYKAKGGEQYLAIGRFFKPEEKQEIDDLILLKERTVAERDSALRMIEDSFAVKYRNVPPPPKKVAKSPEKSMEYLQNYIAQVNVQKRIVIDSVINYYDTLYAQLMEKSIKRERYDVRVYFDNVSIVPEGEREIAAAPKLPFKVGVTYKFNNVNFDLDKDMLKPQSYEELDNIASIMKTYPEFNLELSGHTDNLNTESYNQTLSENRAKACVNYLVQKGIDLRRLTARGFGETKPVATNDTEEGRAMNRRVEFVFLQPETK